PGPVGSGAADPGWAPPGPEAPADAATGAAAGAPAAPRPAAAPVEVRRRTRGVRASDVYATLGAAAGAVSLTALVYTQVAPFTGLVGFVLLSYVLFLVSYAVLTWLGEPGPTVRDRLAAAAVHSLAAVLFGMLGFVVVYALVRGFSALRHLNFYTQDMT